MYEHIIYDHHVLAKLTKKINHPRHPSMDMSLCQGTWLIQAEKGTAQAHIYGGLATPAVLYLSPNQT